MFKYLVTILVCTSLAVFHPVSFAQPMGAPTYMGGFDDGAKAAVWCGTNKGSSVVVFITKDGERYVVPVNCGPNI